MEYAEILEQEEAKECLLIKKEKIKHVEELTGRFFDLESEYDETEEAVEAMEVVETVILAGGSVLLGDMIEEMMIKVKESEDNTLIR